MTKRTVLEIPTGATEYFVHVGLMLKLLDDKADMANTVCRGWTRTSSEAAVDFSLFGNP